MKTPLQRRLDLTMLLIGVALVAVVPTAFVVGAHALDLLAPRWGGGIEEISANDARAVGVGKEIPLGELDSDGVRLTLAYDPSGGTSIRDDSCPPDPPSGSPSSTCRVALSDQLLSPDDVRLVQLGAGVYRVEPAGRSPTVVEVWLKGSRPVQLRNLASPRFVPAFTALFGALALVFALLRARLGVVYARRVYAWKELTLTREGMLQDDDGATVGTVGRDVHLPAGRVLVDGEATQAGGSIYRELAIVARRAIAKGSHAQWVAGTHLRLRDARILCLVATTTAAVAALVHVLSS